MQSINFTWGTGERHEVCGTLTRLPPSPIHSSKKKKQTKQHSNPKFSPRNTKIHILYEDQMTTFVIKILNSPRGK